MPIVRRKAAVYRVDRVQAAFARRARTFALGSLRRLRGYDRRVLSSLCMTTTFGPRLRLWAAVCGDEGDGGLRVDGLETVYLSAEMEGNGDVVVCARADGDGFLLLDTRVTWGKKGWASWWRAVLDRAMESSV